MTPVPAETPARTDTGELAASLRLSVTRLARLLRQQSDAALTPTQLAALATIDRSGPLSIGALAEVEQIGAPTATKVADKLCGAGYVERRADPGDRRVTRLATTPAGRRLLADIRARKTAWLTTRLHELSPAELTTLTDALAVLDHLTAPPAQAVAAAEPAAPEPDR
jgi:DNA-binding MarR family transcriptional regulator